MNTKVRLAASAVLAAMLLVLGTGCGGVDAQGSVSPLMFLLPGVGQVKPEKKAPVPDAGATNAVLVARSN